MSLLQRPIDRITKYRLFVETICKNCIKLGHSTANIQNSFERICNQLNQINRNTEDRNIHKELFELIDFSTIRHHEMQIDFQFLVSRILLVLVGLFMLKTKSQEVIIYPFYCSRAT